MANIPTLQGLQNVGHFDSIPTTRVLGQANEWQ